MSECIHDLDPNECVTCRGGARQISGSNTRSMAGKSFALIYAPDLFPDTFIHLNVEGDSWKIRDYPNPEAKPVVVEQAGQKSKRGVLRELSELRIEIREPYAHSSTGFGESVENSRYWHDEIVKLNLKHGVGL